MATFNNPRHTAATVTASATLVRGYHTPVDATAGPLTMTLPGNAPVGVEISVEKVDSSANTVTVSGTLRGAVSSTPLTSQYEARTFLSEGNGSWRPTSDHRTATSLTTVVTSALAADPTPKNAAAAAVAGALTDSGLVSGGAPYVGLEDVAFSLLDSAGRRSWLEVALDGTPPQRVRTLLATLLAANLPNASIHAAALNADAGLPNPTTSLTAVWSLVDSADRLAAYVTPDGAFDVSKTGPKLAALIGTNVQSAVNALNAFAGPIAAWGDSLTAGGWPALAATELGVAFTSGTPYAIGGQGSSSIAARQGARPALLTAPITIPADLTPITVALDTVVYSSSSGTGTTSGTGSLYGIPGTLTRDNVSTVVTFARTTAGTATWVPLGTPYIPDAAVANRGQAQVIWTGRNSFNAAGADAVIVDYVKRMVAYSTAARPRFLVLEIPPFVGDETTPSPTTSRTRLDATNAALMAAFPNEFVPVAQYLRSDQAFTDAGVVKSSQDSTDIAAGLTPTAFRGTDPGHPNATGNSLVAKYVAKHIRLRGWVA